MKLNTVGKKKHKKMQMMRLTHDSCTFQIWRKFKTQLVASMSSKGLVHDDA